MPEPQPLPAAQITVRRLAVADAADMARLMADADVYPSLMQLPLPSVEMWRARLEANAAADRSAELHLAAEIGGRVVGSAGLHPQAPLRRRHVAMLGISVGADSQGRGVGTALMQAICDYADNWAQILRIELTVFTDNQRAIGLYQRFGFRHEGTHRAFAMRHGAYADVFSMARLHPAPPLPAWPAA